MKLPNQCNASSLSLAIMAGLSLVTPALAVINIEYVTVGYAGNAPDNSAYRADSSGFGAVDYAYQIGKYEVTNAQYTAFLNAADPSGANANGIYNPIMGMDPRGGITYTSGAASGSKYTIRTSMGDKPVTSINWYDAARFTNWLHNGQGAGSTETGAYTLTGDTGIITRNVGAAVWLPSENEWYKAAYYDPTPGASGNNYWLYATQSDTTPTAATANSTGDVSNPGANVVNYVGYRPDGSFGGAGWGDSPAFNVTTVGSTAANNFFGTFDQGGNVFEWTDGVRNSNERVTRGGFWGGLDGDMRASHRRSSLPTTYSSFNGFRVASVSVVPETSSAGPLLFLFAGVALFRRRS